MDQVFLKKIYLNEELFKNSIFLVKVINVSWLGLPASISVIYNKKSF